MRLSADDFRHNINDLEGKRLVQIIKTAKTTRIPNAKPGIGNTIATTIIGLIPMATTIDYRLTRNVQNSLMEKNLIDGADSFPRANVTANCIYRAKFKREDCESDE